MLQLQLQCKVHSLTAEKTDSCIMDGMGLRHSFLHLHWIAEPVKCLDCRDIVADTVCIQAGCVYDNICLQAFQLIILARYLLGVPKP